MLNAHAFDALTFDCYGTLIDWESGIVAAIKPILEAHGLKPTREAILAHYAKREPEAEQGPFVPYREVLRRVMASLAKDHGFEPTDGELRALEDSLPGWPPFPDTVDALRRLARRYKLAVISNVDDDLFAGTQAALGVDFDWVVTAQQVGSYKPNPRNFEVALDRIGVPRDRVLHVAQSLHHDIAPASAMGLTTVWVNRRKGKAGCGATPDSTARPDHEVASLAELVNWLGV